MSLAEQYAEEHERFLEDNTPAVLRGLKNPTS